MKRILYTIILSFSVVFLNTSCDFDTRSYMNIDSENAFITAKDVTNGTNGSYSALGAYRFYGTNILAMGDMSTDISAGTSGGHYISFSSWSILDSQEELKETWDYGYKVVSNTTRTIIGGKKLLNQNISGASTIEMGIAESYALRALAYHTLVNYFAFPYHEGTENLGLALLTNKPLEKKEPIKRSTVGETYTLILNDIASAKQYLADAISHGATAKNEFYMNEAAIYALEARVKMSMHDYAGAKSAAQKALQLKNAKDISNAKYVEKWSSLEITDEDIFTISKSLDDNLSSNSINTLYGTYKAEVKKTLIDVFNKTSDIRYIKLISDNHPKKFDGINGSGDTNNLPVFRVAEMYLIIAEAEARSNNIIPAQEALFHTARRDASITSSASLPNTQNGLIDFISKEYMREFFQEGVRYFYLRRTNEPITVGYGSNAVSNFDISKFVYPIPSKEINAKGGVSQQNEGWADRLPSNNK